MSALIATIVSFIVAGLAVLGLVPHQQMQPVPQMPQDNSTPIVQQQPITRETNVPNFQASPMSGAPSLYVYFTTDLPRSSDQYAIDFGDGSHNTTFAADSCSMSPESKMTHKCSVYHTYSSPGKYEAALLQVFSGKKNVDVLQGGSTGGESITIATATITVTGSSQSSVPGMSKYTDADFGFSFWYPSGWIVTQTLGSPYGPNVSPDINVKKRVLVKSSQTSEHPIVFSLDVMYSADGSVPSMAKTGSPPGMISKTMGGLSMSGLVAYTNYLIRLNNYNYLYLAPNGGTDAASFVKTIVATDPSVATPVSVAEQIKTIQAEKDAYAGQ